MSVKGDLIRAVGAALRAAGEQECRVRYTRTRKRSWYAGDAPGWRMTTEMSIPAFTPAEAMGVFGDAIGTSYLCIGHDGNTRKILERYAGILNAAGFPTRISGTHLHPTALRVWIDRPWTDADEDVDEPA